MPAERFRSGAATHPGAVRDHNEDAFVDRPDLGLWAVADGAGGHDSGALAARTVAEALEAVPAGLPAAPLLALVRQSVGAAHEHLRREAAARGPDVTIASTVVVLIARDSHFACLWAGDSRAYLLRGGTLSQITRDHSLVQELVEAGAVAPEDAESHPRANVITRAVGAGDTPLELDKISAPLRAGDRFLLCSDGLCKTLAATALSDLLARPDGADMPDMLLQAALAQQARDNITAVTVEIG